MQLAIYGKGGIGKSTIISNLSALFCNKGKKVLQVGCDPKGDSTKLLMAGQSINSILDNYINSNAQDDGKKIIHESRYGVLCCESGGPEPGEGCAGRGIIKAFELLNEIIDMNDFDVINYDVLGDVVCGGFAMPIRMGYADNVIIVVSGEIMSLFAANNILKTIHKSSTLTNVRLKGIILNSRNVPHEIEIVDHFCKKTKSILLGIIPRSSNILFCDINNKLFINEYPDSDESGQLNIIAEKIFSETHTIPAPMNREEYNQFISEIRSCSK